MRGRQCAFRGDSDEPHRPPRLPRASRRLRHHTPPQRLEPGTAPWRGGPHRATLAPPRAFPSPTPAPPAPSPSAPTRIPPSHHPTMHAPSILSHTTRPASPFAPRQPLPPPPFRLASLPRGRGAHPWPSVCSAVQPASPPDSAAAPASPMELSLRGGGGGGSGGGNGAGGLRVRGRGRAGDAGCGRPARAWAWWQGAERAVSASGILSVRERRKG